MTVCFAITVADPNAHCFGVMLTLENAQAGQRVSLPVWAPGSYLVREFSRHLLNLSSATHSLRQINKNTWEIDCESGASVVLQYQIYAFDRSVRAAYLDAESGFFNGTSVYLRCHGLEAQTQHVHFAAHQDWRLATALTPGTINGNGFGDYSASDYDALVDTPVAMGHYKALTFQVRGVPHRMVIFGSTPGFDPERLRQDSEQVCSSVVDFWHPDRNTKPPQRDYLFMLLCTHQGYGGLEHRNSTVLLCARADLPRIQAQAQNKGYATLLGLISHEYFHTWLVKRLQPAELVHIDYDRENYTELLWLFEGFTSYYDDLLVLRAGLADEAGYLKRLAQSINHVRATPGRLVQSVAQASFDAWVKYYRPDANTPNTTISYYSKGALIALCLDLSLRNIGSSLDACMRLLWQKHGPGTPNNGAICEADLAAVLHTQSGKDWHAELANWIHGTGDLPFPTLLAQHGIAITQEEAAFAQRLGLRVQEHTRSLFVKQVQHGSAAEQAGLAAGDEILAVQTRNQRWRLRTLDALSLYSTGKSCMLWISRDEAITSLYLKLPTQTRTWQLHRKEPSKTQWPLASIG